MARFVFKLQNVLNLRERLEEQQKIAFAQAESKRDEELFKLQNLEKVRASCEEKLRESSSGSINIDDIKHVKRDIKATEYLIEDQTKVLMAAENEVERQRVLLADAVKERKIYEKLREKAFEDFLREEEAKEKSTIDELVSARYAANIVEGGMTDGEEE